MARFPIGFSTLGCPKWPWRKVLDEAARLGYAGIELRGLEGEIDLVKRPEFGARALATSLEDLRALDLVITDLGASARSTCRASRGTGRARRGARRRGVAGR